MRPTHADLMRHIEANGALATRINTLLGELFQIVENVEAAVDRIDGRVEKVEAKVLKYDLMGARLIGALGAFAVAATAIWWFIHDKVAKLLGADG